VADKTLPVNAEANAAALAEMKKSKPRYFLAVPCLNFQMDSEVRQGIMGALAFLGTQCGYYELTGNSNISGARNKIAHVFMRHTECEELICWDSDIVATLEDLCYLLDGDEDIVIAPYARKKLGEPPTEWGMGFCRIKRSVFQRLADWLIDEGPESGVEALPRYMQDGELAVHYYFTGAAQDMRWFGEDTGFWHWCNVSNKGITMRKEFRCRLGHVGRMVYRYPEQIPGYVRADDAAQ